MIRKIQIVALAMLSAVVAQAQQTVSLAGAWDFLLPQNEEQALNPPQSSEYNDYVMLPGSMLTNDKGNPVSVDTKWTGSLYDSSFYFNPWMQPYREPGATKFPFFLTPAKHYVGTAWYHRSVYVHKAWKNQRVFLFLERPHIETTLYVNGKEVGHEMSLSTPHRYDITRYLKFGKRNDISIKVYNGIENVCVGQDSHSVTDQTQGNWNGIVGRIELQTQWRRLNIKNVRIQPNIKKRQVQVEVRLENHTDGVRLMPFDYHSVSVSVRRIGRQQKLLPGGVSESREALGTRKRFRFNLGEDAVLWDEFEPNLYLVTIEADNEVYETTFGLREIKAEGRQLTINGRPLFLRGTVENCCFPETGYPPMEEDEWMRMFLKCKEYGLNHVRFHSYCPPEAAFVAADRVGIYLQPEAPSWPNHGVKLRRGMAVDQYLIDESKRIIDEYGHHPSFVMMAAGNEPAGDWVPYCNDWVETMRKYDPTKLYCGASVGGGWAWDSGSDYHVKGGGRGLDNWNNHEPSSDDDYYSSIEYPRNYKGSAPNQSPIIAHEQGQWCAFPDLSEMPLYTGVYKPGNLEIFADLLKANGMGGMAEKFLQASGNLQTLCYKYEIERNLRTKDYAGFQLLGLNDYSGQGTATVGVLNVHWREKGYCKAADWREFCNFLVPLARFPKFVYTTADTLVVPVELYNATFANLANAKVKYYVGYDDEHMVTGGRLPGVDIIGIGKNTELGTVRIPLSEVKAPAKLTLSVCISEVFKNHWDFWVYPAADKVEELQLNKDFCIADTVSEQVIEVLQKGGTVLLTAAGKVTLGCDVKQTYLPVFWNTSWFKMRPPHTTGVYIRKEHPLFKHGFPTDDWANLNWWQLVNKAQVMNLMELPADYQSPIQPIDTWHISRKLGMMVEARVGNGRLLMTTMDISSRLDQRHVARQMRKAILEYMQSDDFQPSLMLDETTLRHFFNKQAPAVNMFTKDSPDELKPKIK